MLSAPEREVSDRQSRASRWHRTRLVERLRDGYPWIFIPRIQGEQEVCECEWKQPDLGKGVAEEPLEAD